MLTLGQLIKHHRISHNWTCTTLAEKLGISTTQMSAIEKGRKRPSFEVYLKISEFIYLSAIYQSDLDKAYFIAKYSETEYKIVRDMWQNIFNEEKGVR